MADLVFLHGLDSSSRGTKARYFRAHFPAMLVPDFAGPLAERMASLEAILTGNSDLTLFDDDHLLRQGFAQIDWPRLLGS